jgi:hypothetical protein
MFSGLTKCGVWMLLVILVVTCQPVLSDSRYASAATINLRSYGWEPPDRRSPVRNWPSIAIDHTGRVVVGFAVRERTGLVTRTKPSIDFRILRFSQNGKAELSLSLPTSAGGRTGIYLSDSDQIIVRANDSLQLLQDEVPPGVWKVLAPCAYGCNAEQSVSRHTLLLYTEQADPVTLIRLSEQPMLRRCGKERQFLKSMEDRIQNWPNAITDEFAYFLGGERDYRWHFCDYERRIELPMHAVGRFKVLNDKVFVANTYDTGKNGSRLEVISSDGQVKFRPEMGRYESAGSLFAPIRSSERGDRIAVDMFAIRGANRTLDISGHITAHRIAMYDIEAGKTIASIPVDPKPRYRFEFDLSPDGHHLAILDDDTVRIVDF